MDFLKKERVLGFQSLFRESILFYTSQLDFWVKFIISAGNRITMDKVNAGRVTRSTQTIKCFKEKVNVNFIMCLSNKESVEFSMSSRKIIKSGILNR